MDREAAKRLIRQTLEQPFNRDQFLVFIKNLLNHIEVAPFTYRGNYIFADFQDYVDTLERIGKYEDSDGNKLDVLVVHLKKTTSLERARASQRKFVAKYLKGSRGNELKDAALVAFVSPNEEDWRFSFVKMDYKIETTEKGRVKVKEEFTPARRYSFLVGKNENSHTAQSQLLPILENTDQDPTIRSIEERFSIEKVTKEFFEQYRELYHKVKDALNTLVTKDKDIREDFKNKGVNTVDFSKKLLGQIVFLYFLQKKGWFGLKLKAKWGSGSKAFLRELFDSKHREYKNFFNDILEPLFYDALAREREHDYHPYFNSRIPFLNGGLFDPLNNYDWVNTDILLPNELFSNDEKTKQGDVGTGVLDVFDRYNFTVKEDEPLEKEVAIDPEMLGKVFENLLEVKDRKSKGTYYTPREIVHYMCQESLINYLATELQGTVPREDIETLIKHGETALENDALVSERGEERGRYKYKLPESVRDNAQVIDEKLADIKVCDPAVGSGAFLVGMMSEIVRTRMVLSEFLDTDMERTAYDLKRHAIQNSLYGVDIDLGAVEIAKLRLWLSLIVDEEDYKHIKPLPNLDYKIMQGNSLLEEYESIKLIDERFFDKREEKVEIRERLEREQSQIQRDYIRLDADGQLTKVKKAEYDKRLREIEKQLKEIDKPRSNGQDNLGFFGQTEAQSKADELLDLQERFFNAHHKSDKDRIHKQIDELTWDLIETTLKQKGKEEKLEDVKRFQRTNTSPFFLWQLNFADVFRERGGFNVVIGNPPYGAKLSTDEKNELDIRFIEKKSQTKNSAIYFIYVCERLLCLGGINSFIVPKSLTYSMGWGNCASTVSIGLQKLIDSGRAFEKVKLEQVIFIRTPDDDSDSFINGLYNGTKIQEIATIDKVMYRDYKVLLCGQTIEEINIIENIMAHSDGCFGEHVSIERGLNWQSKVTKYPGKTPIYRGAQVRPYFVSQATDYISLKHFSENEYRYQFKPKILNQLAIAHVQNPYPHFYLQAGLDTKQRLVFETISCTFIEDKCVDIKFVLGYNNSKLFAWLLYKLIYSNAIRSTRYDYQYVSRLPWPRAANGKQNGVVDLVNSILKITENSDYKDNKHKQIQVNKYMAKIDSIFYELFKLSPDEIAIVEGNSKAGKV